MEVRYVWTRSPGTDYHLWHRFLIFGGKKLPEIGAGLGKGITSFKNGLKEVEETVPDVKEISTLSEEVK